MTSITAAVTSSAAQKRQLEDEDLELETENQNKRTRVDENVNKEECIELLSADDDVIYGDEQNLEVEISVPDQTEQATGRKSNHLDIVFYSM